MNLIDKYIIRQYLVSSFFLLAMIMIIAVMVDVMEKIDFLLGEKPPLNETITDYYFNFVAYFGNLLSPICIFLGVIFFTSRMAARTEIVPILSSGVSFGRLLAPYFFVALLTMTASFFLKSFLVPNSTEARLDYEYKYMYKQKRRLTRMTDIHKKVANDVYVYFHHFNERTGIGTNFGMERLKDGEVTSKLSAKTIRWVDSTRNWRLEKVEIRNLDGMREKIERYPSLDTIFLLTPEEIFIREQLAESMTLPTLLDFIEKEEMRGSDILTMLYLERHRRFSDPVSIFILTMLGFAISFEKRRGGIALKIGLGMLLAFFYVALLYGGEIIVGEEYPPWLAVWTPNLIFLPITAFQLVQASNRSLFGFNMLWLKNWWAKLKGK
jgi:lipopolysaccharide export system permease protein